MRYKHLLGALALVFGAHVVILADAPLLWQAMATLLLAGLVPGVLFVEVLVGRSEAPPSLSERILYSIAAGYGIMVVTMLFVHYVPGGISRWETLAAFDVVLFVLFGLAWWRMRTTGQPSAPVWPAVVQPVDRRWLVAGLLVLLLVGGFFRFTNLGYSEYQGDEARAALRSAAAIDGYDDVLFLHKKGPTEILLPTTLYSISGRLTEHMARLPFAIANLTALFAVFVLGWRLFGPIAGWTAAIVLTLDGYFIGFSRIVQYQSIVFLMTILTVLILYRLVQQPKAMWQYLTLAALFLATGIYSHYEAGLAAVPAVYFLWVIWRRGTDLTKIGRSVIAPMAVGAVTLATFYVPFVLHPHFRATYTYLTERRIGGSFPYNNIEDFFIRTTLYNSTYAVVLLIALATLALAAVYWRGLQGRRAVPAIGMLVLGLLLTAWQPSWLSVGASDYTVAFFVLVLAGAWVLPRVTDEERVLWIWFSVPMLAAFFFTVKPRTHVYLFFMPWALLVGMFVERGWYWARDRFGVRPTQYSSIAIAALAIVVFANYEYWYFVHNRVEVLRTWEENRPAGYWTVYDEPDEHGIFGFPLANGWKVVGSLYHQGVLSGAFETGENEDWVPAWYTRGERRCERTAEWYFEIDNLESWTHQDQLKMEHYLRQGFQLWGTVEINEAHRLKIHRRTDEPIEPRVIPLEEWEAYFDQITTPHMPFTYPVVSPPEIPNELHVNLHDQIWLEGYDLQYEAPLMPGDTFRVTYYWRAQRPVDADYKVFNHVYFQDSGMQAQLDGYPVCDSRATWRWDPGEVITDSYEVPVNDDATPGLYPLYVGMYTESTGERVPVIGEDGAVVGEQIHVTDIRIGEE